MVSVTRYYTVQADNVEEAKSIVEANPSDYSDMHNNDDGFIRRIDEVNDGELNIIFE